MLRLREENGDKRATLKERVERKRNEKRGKAGKRRKKKRKKKGPSRLVESLEGRRRVEASEPLRANGMERGAERFGSAGGGWGQALLSAKPSLVASLINWHLPGGLVSIQPSNNP